MTRSLTEIMQHCAVAITNAVESDCGIRRGGVAFEVRAMFRDRDSMADRVDIANGGLHQEQTVETTERSPAPQLPAPRAPDWSDLWERYHAPSLCTCRGDSGPCQHCQDGWQDDIDWEHERETTGYVLELDGTK